MDVEKTYKYNDIPSVNQSWSFTVKKLGSKDVTPEDYKSVIALFKTFGYLDCHYYETDPHGKLHVHGVIQLRKGFMRKKLCLSGFHTFLKEIFNRAGWQDYITKDQFKNVDTTQHYDNNNYMFEKLTIT